MLLTLTTEQCAELRQQKYHAGTFRFADVGFHIFSDNKAYIDAFKKIYEAFVVQNLDADACAYYILDTCNFCIESCVVIEDTLYELPTGERFISIAEVLIFQRVIDNIRNCLLIHAGVVKKNDNGYIVYAHSGFGKTTFVLSLVLRGYTFLSDEYCPIKADSLIIEPFNRRVGIKKNSPFVESALYHAKDTICFDDKYYVGCNDLIPKAKLGGPCRAKFFIMLSDEAHDAIEHETLQKIKIVLFDDNQGIIKKLCQYKGIRVLERHVYDHFTEYILVMPRYGMLTGILHRIIKEYERCIWFVTPLYEHKTDFSNTPQLKEMKKSEAAFEILSNLANRSPSSALLENHDQKHQHLLMKIGSFLKDVECYRLTTGNLDDMVRLVDAL